MYEQLLNSKKSQAEIEKELKSSEKILFKQQGSTEKSSNSPRSPSDDFTSTPRAKKSPHTPKMSKLSQILSAGSFGLSDTSNLYIKWRERMKERHDQMATKEDDKRPRRRESMSERRRLALRCLINPSHSE
jgi:hypothetical protein